MGDRSRLTCALTVAALVGGCGDGDDYANDPRPPSPINVTAAITERGLAVSPERFGAGPITLIVSNQTDSARSVTFETDELGGAAPGLKQTTSPINPAGTASIKLDVREGSYRMSTDDTRARAASIEVGEPRESAQDQLLQP